MKNVILLVLVIGLPLPSATANDPGIHDFGWKLPQGFVRQYHEPAPMPLLERVPQVHALAADGSRLTLSYLGEVSLTGGERPLDYFRKGLVQYLRDYMETVPVLLHGADIKQLSLLSLGEHQYVAISAELEGQQITAARVMLDAHVLEIALFSSPEQAVLSQLRLDNFLDSLEPPAL